MLMCRQEGVTRVNVAVTVVQTAALVADKERRVIKFVQPQGSVGYAIYTLQKR